MPLCPAKAGGVAHGAGCLFVLAMWRTYAQGIGLWLVRGRHVPAVRGANISPDRGEAVSETTERVLYAVQSGRLVECSPLEYPEVRIALQDQAGKWIDYGDHRRAQIALQEVRRLDTLFLEKP